MNRIKKSKRTFPFDFLLKIPRQYLRTSLGSRTGQIKSQIMKTYCYIVGKILEIQY